LEREQRRASRGRYAGEGNRGGKQRKPNRGQQVEECMHTSSTKETIEKEPAEQARKQKQQGR
jgi:hypothetical protein